MIYEVYDLAVRWNRRRSSYFPWDAPAERGQKRPVKSCKALCSVGVKKIDAAVTETETVAEKTVEDCEGLSLSAHAMRRRHFSRARAYKHDNLPLY